MRSLLACVCVPMLCLAQETASFRVGVRLVNVSFTARDARGALVTDLTKDEMEILEDGVPQAIAFFARSSELPLSLGLAIDSSGSQDSFGKRHERDLKDFLKSVLTPRDRAFLLYFANRLRLVSDYSGVPSEIMDSLKRFEKDDRGRNLIAELGPRDELRLGGTAFYDAIYHSSRIKLAGADHPRKALLVFSDGEDNSSAFHMMDAVEAAQSENVILFPIRYTEVKKGRWTARNKYGKRVMERIARETGGVDYDAEATDMKKAFHSIGEELRSSYEVAYHSKNPLSDGLFHKLAIRSKRAGVTIRTKTGFYARE